MTVQQNHGLGYVLDEGDYAYQLPHPTKKGCTYTVDDPKPGHGWNDGLGQPDAQCPHDLKFIDNKANAEIES